MCCYPDCPVFEDVGCCVVDADGCGEVAVAVFVEFDGFSGAGVVDFACGEVVLPFAGDVFVPGDVVCGVDAGCSGCHGFGVGYGCWLLFFWCSAASCSVRWRMSSVRLVFW